MKTSDLNKNKGLGIKVDKALNKYDEVVLAPEKVDKANKMLKNVGLPLNIDDDNEVPEWHNKILEERVVKYEKSNSKLKDWDKVQEKL
jgi:hypothetical protein